MPTPYKGTTPQATCHPKRKMHAKGLCRSCYEKSLNKNPKYRKDGRSLLPGYKKKWSQTTARGRELNRNAYTKYRFGISRDEYERLRAIQNGLCGLCKKPMDMENKKSQDYPVLDHCHLTKKNREFIHRRCNIALGLFQDDPVTCRLAAEYLEKHRR